MNPFSMNGLESYIVVLSDTLRYQFWAENEEHAREQALDAVPYAEITEVYPEWKVIYSRTNPNASWNLPK